MFILSGVQYFASLGWWNPHCSLFLGISGGSQWSNLLGGRLKLAAKAFIKALWLLHAASPIPQSI